MKDIEVIEETNSDGQDVLVVKREGKYLFGLNVRGNSMMIDDPDMKLICKNRADRTHTEIYVGDAQEFKAVESALRTLGVGR